jgi:hypothetical protein
MARFKFRSKTKLDPNKSRRRFSIYRSLSGAWTKFSNRYNSDYSKYKRNRHNYNIFPVIALLFGSPVFANTSNTAAPSASASGSVSNFATQVLGGPMVENMYGNNIKCSGPQMTLSPFVTTSFNQKRPQDYIYRTPVYDNTDANDDNVPDNPGNILFYQENYSGNKDSLGLNFGFALTFNIPLDNRFQDSCLDAANTQIQLQKQELSAKRLNYEIARLKNCGELMIAGISFHPESPYAALCADVVISPKANQVLPHNHEIKINK